MEGGLHKSNKKRQLGLDGLRAVAALIVVLYHFSRRYGERYDPNWHPIFNYDGGVGVLIFFMISGYVITMTTQDLRRPIDFLFLRASRLYPTYWLCLLVTTTVVVLAKFPPPLPTASSVCANLTMVTKSFRRLPGIKADIPYIDGAYWSLEIELFFYLIVFALVLCNQMKRIVSIALVLIAVSAIDHWLLRINRSPIPAQVRWFLIFDYWPYFGVGIAMFSMKHQHRVWLPAAVIVLAMLRVSESTLSGVPGAWIELIKTTMGVCLFTGVVFDRLPFMSWRPLVALGAISYPLYLLHQNVGYVVLRLLSARFGWSATASIALTVLVVIGLAAIISITFERPTMRYLRNGYRHRTTPKTPLGLPLA